MRIKHFAGYGCVEAKKTKLVKKPDGTKVLTITVTGNHERGLERDDKYDLFNWLVKRFDKTVKDSRKILNVQIQDDYIKQGNLDVEQCVYTFVLAA